MRRGELYLVRKPGHTDPRKQRVFVVVSRQLLLDSSFATAVCAPVYSRHDGLSTQVMVGVAEGLKHESSVHCDELVSLPKSMLTHFVGSLGRPKLREVDFALATALEIESLDDEIGLPGLPQSTI
jgi:mRNA interferase MazF